MRKGSNVYGNYLEKYKIIDHIADGGNSHIYKVEDSNGKIYALKLLNKGISAEKIKRFKNEMFFCIKSDHPNIIKIIDNGITDDKSQIFYIMPYYNKTLRNYINEDHTSQEKIQLFIDILQGVNFFHKKGIIHRDIKPENILISTNNVPIISDFGIAHFSEDDLVTQIETRIGSKMANFQYAAPEQRARGENITIKVDIYALGLIFNEMFTKKIPFGNAYKKVSDEDNNCSFLDAIIDKMISQNPNDRFENVEDVIYELRIAIDLNQKNKEIEKLKKVTFSENEEDDILILDPPKLIDFKYNDVFGELELYLDKSVNDQWVSCMTYSSYEELLGFGPERFRFNGKVATVQLPEVHLNSLQLIINYFKTWVDNANKYYPIQVKKKREMERRKKEDEIRAKIEREEKIARVLQGIHI